jgi:site-specific DNA recombinase
MDGGAATRTIAYIRVSTDKQAERGLSLEAQREKVHAYALLYNLDIVEVIVDAGVSAKTLERPGLTRALTALRDGRAQALLVTKLDRLTRSVRDLGELVERIFGRGECALLSVSEQIDTRSAAGRLVLNVLASVSQWEREAIGERTATVLRHKASRGEYTGGDAPYGFAVTPDGKLVERDDEQAAVAFARRLQEGGFSLRAIAAELARATRRLRGEAPCRRTRASVVTSGRRAHAPRASSRSDLVPPQSRAMSGRRHGEALARLTEPCWPCEHRRSVPRVRSTLAARAPLLNAALTAPSLGDTCS